MIDTNWMELGQDEEADGPKALAAFTRILFWFVMIMLLAITIFAVTGCDTQREQTYEVSQNYSIMEVQQFDGVMCVRFVEDYDSTAWTCRGSETAKTVH
jgi:hypothetical protein